MKVMQTDATAARRGLARRIAEEGAVLLKNEGNLLPFAKGTRVAVFGRTQVETIKGGTGSANCDCEYTVSLIDGIRGAGISCDETLAEVYRTWTAAHPIPKFGVWGSGMHCAPEMPLTREMFDSVRADAAVVIIGRTAGENEDVALSEGDWYLSADERTMLSAVTERFPGRTAVLLNSGGMIDLSFLDTFGVSAFLHCFMPGMEGARAIGDLLAGRATPSGKLTSTVAHRYEDYPSAGHFGQTGGGILQDYTEDIYVGYRYFLTFAKEKVRYPFGFGLSYTTFALSDVSASEQDGNITVSCRVTNTGDTYPGREVVQVYFSAPEEGRLSRPARTLAGFAKTGLLAPGKSETVTVGFPVSDFAGFDDTGVTGHRDCFVTEAGDFCVYIGTSSFADTLAFVHRQECTAASSPLTHLDTTLPLRLSADGGMEPLETLPTDPREGIRVLSEGRTTVPVSMAAYGDMAVGDDLSSLEAGRSVTYRLIAGVSGGYRLYFEGNVSGRFSDYGSLLLGGVEQTGFDPDLSDPSGTEIILPSGVSELTVRAKRAFPARAFPAVTALVLEKTNPVVRVAAGGTTSFAATDFYECAYGLNVKHFRDGGDGKPVSVLSHFWNPGKSVTYKLYAEQAGVYDMTIRYANFKEDTVLSDACALFVSNVGQTLAAVPVRHTCGQEDDPHLTDETLPVQIALPAGECYLKLVSAVWQFPDLVSFSLTRSEKTAVVAERKQEEQTSSEGGNYEPSLITDDHDAPKASVTLSDVADGKHTMEELLSLMSDDDLIRLVSGNPRNKNTVGVSGCICSALLRYGIPPLETADGPLGLRINALTTAFPSGSMLSSSWDPVLAEDFGRAVGEESELFDVDIWLAPGINIYRDPRCGRNFEYYSEDPLLSARIACGVTRGVQASGTAVCVKHFAVNNTEHERLKSDSRVSARAEREIYLRNFERVLRESDPWCVMSSYNHVNGRKASEQRALITDIAHGEWGWDGVILSDWDNDSSHVRELLAGQDIKMSAGDPAAVSAALADGTLSRRDLEIPAARILRLVMKSRAFRNFRKIENG